MPTTAKDQPEFATLLATMRTLRDPNGGCPWDLEQTHASLQHTMLEESYEAMEALDSGDTDAMVEELGDLLIQVVFHAQIGADNGTFTMADVVRRANDKLVGRHPHVFGKAHAPTAEDVKRQWDQIKAEERRAQGKERGSTLDGVPRTMPALAYAQAVQSRVVRAGLRWEGDTASELADLASTAARERSPQRFGELLFAVVQAAREAAVEAEEALREANLRFYQRFLRAEELARDRGGTLAGLTPNRRVEVWRQAEEAP